MNLDETKEYKVEAKKTSTQRKQSDDEQCEICGECLLDIYEKFDEAVMSADVQSLDHILLELYQILLLINGYKPLFAIY